MIRCQGLAKNFRNPLKDPGFIGTLRSFVRRRYRSVRAVSDFNLQIDRGEFVGLLGPNGAGKTTLMKIFTGIIAASQGEVSVLGYDPFQRPVDFRKRIALVMGQKSQLWWDIPAMDSFLLLKSYYDISDRNFEARLKMFGELLGVGELLEVSVRKLSLGERMKMELIASLLHEPELIFLDEPTIGLDLVAQRKIREFLREYQRQSGTTVILTSHYMADVHALCSRIVLILEGRKRFDGPIEEFERILGAEKFVAVVFAEPVDIEDLIWTGLEPCWNDAGTRVELRIAESDFRQKTAAILAKFPVVDLATEKLPIERVMERLLMRPELLEGGRAQC